MNTIEITVKVRPQDQDIPSIALETHVTDHDLTFFKTQLLIS